MNHVVSFSGGRTSAYLVHLIESMRKSGEWTEPVEYIFMDTGAEHPKTYEFIKKCVEHFGVELTCLQGDFNQPVGTGHTYKVASIEECKHDMVNGPFAQLMRKYGAPTVMSAWCTSRMKEETHDKYCDDKYGKGNYITWLGIRADEPRRLKIGRNPKIRYMAEITDFEKDDVLDFWVNSKFRMSKIHTKNKKVRFKLSSCKVHYWSHFDLEIQEHLGNCVFCIKKSINKLALAARDEPELAADWVAAIEAGSDRLSQPKEKKTDGLFVETYTQHIKKGVMYRGSNTIESIIAKFSLHSREEIYDSIRSMKRKESGGCTESCEAFATDQPDLFD